MKFITEKDQLIVRPEGIEKFWGLHGDITASRNQVELVEWTPTFSDWAKGEIRLGGTGAPGLLFAGNFWSSSGWDYLYLRRPRGFWRPVVDNVVVIKLKNHHFRRLLITSDEQTAIDLKAWLG